MATIASLWWLWLAITVLSAGYALFNQARRMKGMVSSTTELDVEGAAKNFTSGLGSMAFAGFVAWISGILLLIAVVIQIIDYVK